MNESAGPHVAGIDRSPLAETIARAAAETAAFNRGRADFRATGQTAVNPFSPREGAHRFWADGLVYERAVQRDRFRA